MRVGVSSLQGGRWTFNSSRVSADKFPFRRQMHCLQGRPVRSLAETGSKTVMWGGHFRPISGEGSMRSRSLNAPRWSVVLDAAR